jgi:quercetin dioxygenase-like cupin family protein
MLLASLILTAPLLVRAAAPSPGPLPDPLQAGWKGKPVCERLLEDDQKRVLRCTFPPGGGHDRHAHVPHFGYALSGGRMRITDTNGVREAVLATGSTFTSTGIPWHEVVNVGDTTVQYLIVESKDPVPRGR